MIKSYGFGNAKITLDSDENFDDGKQMKPFVINECKDCLVCRFRRKDSIDTPEDMPIYASTSYKIFSKDGKTEKHYLIPLIKDEAAVINHADFGYDCKIKSIYSNHFSYGINLINAVGIERIAYEFGMFILHCSCVELNGEAILFSGRSGIGKSTRANLWNKMTGSETINGDKIGLFTENGKLYACGLPVAGSSDVYVNKTLPVRAIIFLEQSPDNYTRKSDLTESLQKLFFNLIINSWDKEFCSDAAEFISRIISCVDIFISECNTEMDSVLEQMNVIGLKND